MEQFPGVERILVTLILVSVVDGTTNASSPSSNSDTSADDGDTSLMAVTTTAVIVGAAIFSVLLAKVLDHCYDRMVIRDDSSDISENTRNIIRARLTVARFRITHGSEKDKSKEDENTKKMFNKWKNKVRAKSVDYGKTNSERTLENSVVINVEQDTSSSDADELAALNKPERDRTSTENSSHKQFTSSENSADSQTSKPESSVKTSQTKDVQTTSQTKQSENTANLKAQTSRSDSTSNNQCASVSVTITPPTDQERTQKSSVKHVTFKKAESTRLPSVHKASPNRLNQNSKTPR